MGTTKLDFRVRNENGYTLRVISTKTERRKWIPDVRPNRGRVRKKEDGKKRLNVSIVLALKNFCADAIKAITSVYEYHSCY
jgi:hypothetical protein